MRICFKIYFIPVVKIGFSASLLQSSLQCHMILQKSFIYDDLMLKKYFWLLSML